MTSRKMMLYIFLISVTILAGTCLSTEALKVSDMNIADTLNASENFTEIVGAIEVAGLIEELSAPENLTIFAPNDDAFSKFPNEDYKALLENETRLKNIVNYHVVEGKILSKDLKDGQELKTLEGETLKIKVGSEGVTINGAKVIQPDIEANNGIIHAIDTVLMPELYSKISTQIMA
jgi:uncharacterized surface protein with fasciclin (FAS1) repeats